MKKKGITISIMAVIWLLFVGLMYYLLLPAINIHCVGLWGFVLGVCLLPAVLLSVVYRLVFNKAALSEEKLGGVEILISAGFVVLAIFLILLIYGSKLFHARRYSQVLKTEEYNFEEDINQASAVSKIALMDTKSAIILGNREIGSLSSLVSQYNVSNDYAQVDFGGAPVKVSALDYAGVFKYFGNRKDGVPGYVKVDPVGQSAEYVELDKGMKYVPSAYFSEDLNRHLRSKYPTKILGNIHFEIDEKGEAFYVASVYKYTIGLFGGKTIAGVIICNPVNGECEYYPVSDIPKWVDSVYTGNLLVEQYNWFGRLNNGFWNSVFGKKGCKKCTETKNVSDDDDDEEESYAPDFGYVAKDGDIWIYTGVTSVNDDASNIGFILVNQRTGEGHYFNIAGADENSAMAAAEGEVQEKRYQASFPSLINVDEQPTYIMVLKDATGIVKLYAMVNVESYNIVTTASNMDECFSKYLAKLGLDDTDAEEKTDKEDKEADDKSDTTAAVEAQISVASIQYAAIDGNTYVYITSADGKVYRQKFSDNEKRLLMLKAGDACTVMCKEQKSGVYSIVEMK